MLLKALNKKTAGVFDAWVRQNHPGEVFDENQLEAMVIWVRRLSSIKDVLH